MTQKTISKKPDALQKLRQIIREEVKSAVKDEIVPILLEVIKSRALTENTVPNYKSTIQPQAPTLSKASNPTPSADRGVRSVLEETRRQMLAEAKMPGADEFTTLLAANTTRLPIQEQINTYDEVESAGHVNAMLATAVKSSKEENVEITAVPDFSSLMKKMNL